MFCPVLIINRCQEEATLICLASHISIYAFEFPQVSTPGQPRKPAKTEKLGNLATYVIFPGNSQNDELWETSETYGNLLTTAKII
jgi:hypothetical protein